MFWTYSHAHAPGQDATAPTVTTNDSLQPETAPMGHDRRSLTVPIGGTCPALPCTCGFRLLGAAYGASGQHQVGGGAADAREGLEEFPESRTGHIRHHLYMTTPHAPSAMLRLHPLRSLQRSPKLPRVYPRAGSTRSMDALLPACPCLPRFAWNARVALQDWQSFRCSARTSDNSMSNGNPISPARCLAAVNACWPTNPGRRAVNPIAPSASRRRAFEKPGTGYIARPRSSRVVRVFISIV